MRMVVTGKAGQVVSALNERAGADGRIEIASLGRPEIDFTQKYGIAQAIEDSRPDIVVNAAAYTAVDKAEEEVELAHQVNAVAAGEVARGAATAGAPIIQLSTDYVFNGEQRRSYKESDAVGPIGAYGRTKLDGEKLVAEANPDHFIFRTAWVYSPYGHNFVKTMLRLAEERDNLSIVDDQLGNPTYALDIADGIIEAAVRILDSKVPTVPGIYHLSGEGTASWCEFTREIFCVVGAKTHVAAIGTEDFPTPARRPRNSRMDCSRFETTFGYRAPRWEISLRDCLSRLGEA